MEWQADVRRVLVTRGAGFLVGPRGVYDEAKRPPTLLAITRVALASVAAAVVIAFRMADWVRNQFFQARTRFRRIRSPRSNRASEQSEGDLSDLQGDTR
jgi:hypothetical protein